jgi:hypothetical protein
MRRIGCIFTAIVAIMGACPLVMSRFTSSRTKWLI